MIPGLESAPEYDRSMILKFVRSDSGSGSFQVDPLESAPVLVSAPLVHCWSFLNQAEPVISYFDVPNWSIYSNLINIGWNHTALIAVDSSMVKFTFGWSRFHTRSRFHCGVGSGSGSFVQIAIPIPESEISGIITALIGTILPNLKMFLLYQTRHKGLRKINGFICLWDEFLFSLHLRGGFWFFRHQIFAFWCPLFKWFFLAKCP